MVSRFLPKVAHFSCSPSIPSDLHTHTRTYTHNVSLPRTVPPMTIKCPVILPVWATPGSRDPQPVPNVATMWPTVRYGTIASRNDIIITINGQPLRAGYTPRLPIGTSTVTYTVRDGTRAGVTATCSTTVDVLPTCYGPGKTVLVQSTRYENPTGKPAPENVKFIWCSKNSPTTSVSCCGGDCNSIAALVPPKAVCMEHNPAKCLQHGTTLCDSPAYKTLCPRTCRLC